MRLSVYLVTRNHETSVGAAVASVAGLADEVVVADTGSTDRTVPTAVAAGGRVVPIAWADDFAAACNDALAAATGDWVLLLNPDEALDPAGIETVRAAVADPLAFAFALPVRQELSATTPGVGTTAAELRLYRRDPTVRYRGRVHPEFDPPLAEVAAARGQIIGVASALIHRFAFLSPVTPDKVRWTNRLLEAELRDRPGRLRFQIELGRNLLRIDDPRGHAVLAEAAEAVSRSADAAGPPDGNVGQLLEYVLTGPEKPCFPLSRADAHRLAERWFPRTPPVLWAAATERYDAGDTAAAAAILDRLLALGASGDFDQGEPFRPDIVGPAAALARAGCHVKLREWAAAKVRLVPLVHDPEYRAKASALYALADRES